MFSLNLIVNFVLCEYFLNVIFLIISHDKLSILKLNYYRQVSSLLVYDCWNLVPAMLAVTINYLCVSEVSPNEIGIRIIHTQCYAEWVELDSTSMHETKWNHM